MISCIKFQKQVPSIRHQILKARVQLHASCYYTQLYLLNTYNIPKNQQQIIVTPFCSVFFLHLVVKKWWIWWIQCLILWCHQQVWLCWLFHGLLCISSTLVRGCTTRSLVKTWRTKSSSSLELLLVLER